MAENKKSVLLYCDLIHTIEGLTDDEAGQLFKHYLRYINDKNPEPQNRLIALLFEPIKQNLKRDLQKWEQKSNKNRENARIRWNDKNANASNEMRTDANNADKDKVTVTVTDKDKVTVKENNIEKRKLAFAESLNEFIGLYGNELIDEFCKYWTEPNKSNTKFRKELQQTWDTKRRLETWAKNQKTFKNNGTVTGNNKQPIATQIGNVESIFRK